MHDAVGLSHTLISISVHVHCTYMYVSCTMVVYFVYFVRHLQCAGMANV